MPIPIDPELLLYIIILMKNWLSQGLKSLEGKSKEEIKAMVLDDENMKKQLMAELHSTD